MKYLVIHFSTFPTEIRIIVQLKYNYGVIFLAGWHSHHDITVEKKASIEFFLCFHHVHIVTTCVAISVKEQSTWFLLKNTLFVPVHTQYDARLPIMM